MLHKGSSDAAKAMGSIVANAEKLNFALGNLGDTASRTKPISEQ